MKKAFLTILSFLLCASTFATSRRVNNNPGVVTVPGLVYATFQTAFNEAAAGDTLYLEPSLTAYIPVISFNKKLTVIGDGYQKGSNNGLISPLSISLNESILQGNFTIEIGAENSTFIGVYFKSSQLVFTAANIRIKRCRSSGTNAISFIINSASNIIEQCYFEREGGGHSDISGNGSGNIFKNNIFSDIFGSQQNPIVDQCILGGVSNVLNGIFSNCIVWTNSYNAGTNSVFNNSIKIDTPFGTPGNNNIENAALADIFIPGSDSDNDPFDSLIDKDFRLKSGSIALLMGTSGQNIGPFGGTEPYRLSGQAPVPIITNFFLSTTGSTSSGLIGSITIQTNN